MLNADTGEVLFKDGEKVTPRAAKKAQNDGVKTLLVPADEILDLRIGVHEAAVQAITDRTISRRPGAR